MASDKIKVAVRVRPFNRRELELGTQCVVEMESMQTILQYPQSNHEKDRHGDLSKPTGNAQGKMQCIQRWATLTELLNSDGSGETKPLEKWKKVWSDLKNNTKRKAARIHRASIGTGGGPPLQAKLTDLEQRVLNIIGTLAATGLEGVPEAGFPQVEDNQGMAAYPDVLVTSEPPPMQTQSSLPVLSTDHMVIDVLCTRDDDWNQPEPSTQTQMQPPHHESLPPYESTPPQPATAGHTPRRRMPTRIRGSPRRRVRQSLSHVDRASEHFLQCEREWRQFQIEKQRQQDEHEKERLRLRALQLEVYSQTQDRWQLLIGRMLDILSKIVDSKLCK